MRQIVQKKKKGRPSRIDPSHSSLAPSTSTPEAEPEPERRRSLRRRNVRYTNFIDYDDYLDEFEEFEEEEEEEDEDDERRREKKFKLVLKLNNEKQKRNKVARRIHAPKFGGSFSSSDIDDDEEIEKKIIKKMKLNGRHESDIDAESENDNDDYQEECRRNVCDKTQKSLPVAPGHQHGFPFPDKRLLELILDKLQKKDIYGVYADPVDLEELPDYLDVIDHPMDFSTVRKKLASGSYSVLEQFESDIFLICSNAMQYNTPDTIYHKQAFSIQELARKKFLKLRIDAERSDKELKPEQKPRSNLTAKKQVKKSLNRTIGEPLGSEVSAGGAAEDVQNGLGAPLAATMCERPSHEDGLFDGNFFLVDNGLEKTEEPSSAKNLLSKFGRKPLVLDENRRSTYNISHPSTSRPESIFTTFDSEIKQLLAVGLHAECSYARSLARFAATLGPAAWKVASQSVEKAIPVGCKYGRGWVGEYEPLPTPVLMLDSPISKESIRAHCFRATVPDPTVALDPIKPTVSEPAAATPRPLLDKLPNGKPISIPVNDRLARLAPCQTERWLPNGCSLEKPTVDAPASNAAVAAARAWMSIGAAGFKPNLETSDRNNHSLPFHAFAARHQSNNGGIEVQFPPHQLPADVPCFQIQAQWHGLNPHSHHSKPKLEPSLPPDLNISFQSPSSPIKLSSGVLLDSQQPDLALQL